MAHTEDMPAPQEQTPAMMTRIGDMAMRGLHVMLGVALLVVVAINVVNATSRYLFGVSPVGADELMIYMVIWVVMVAAIVSLCTRTHISVNLLPLYAKGRARHVLYLLHDIAAVVACGYATYASWLFIGRISRIGVTSMGLGVPMSVPHSALLFGFAGLTIAGAVMFVRDLLSLIRNAPLSETKA